MPLCTLSLCLWIMLKNPYFILVITLLKKFKIIRCAPQHFMWNWLLFFFSFFSSVKIFGTSWEQNFLHLKFFCDNLVHSRFQKPQHLLNYSNTHQMIRVQKRFNFSPTVWSSKTRWLSSMLFVLDVFFPISEIFMLLKRSSLYASRNMTNVSVVICLILQINFMAYCCLKLCCILKTYRFFQTCICIMRDLYATKTQSQLISARIYSWQPPPPILHANFPCLAFY